MEANPLPFESRYYAPKPFKFILLSVTTLGLFTLYWAYKNWAHIKSRDGSRKWPFLRAFFIFVTFYDLGQQMNFDAQQKRVKEQMDIGWLALAFIGLTLLDYLPGAFSALGSLNFIPLLLLNRLARNLNQAAGQDTQEDDRFSMLTIAFMILGLIFWTILIHDWMYPALN